MLLINCPMIYWTWISFIGFPILKFAKPLVFDLRGCTTLKIGKLSGQLLVVLYVTPHYAVFVQ